MAAINRRSQKRKSSCTSGAEGVAKKHKTLTTEEMDAAVRAFYESQRNGLDMEKGLDFLVIVLFQCPPNYDHEKPELMMGFSSGEKLGCDL